MDPGRCQGSCLSLGQGCWLGCSCPGSWVDLTCNRRFISPLVWVWVGVWGASLNDLLYEPNNFFYLCFFLLCYGDGDPSMTWWHENALSSGFGRHDAGCITTFFSPNMLLRW